MARRVYILVPLGIVLSVGGCTGDPRRPSKAGVSAADPSIVFDTPFEMNGGFKAYNGNAYDNAVLCINPQLPLVLPDKDTAVERHDQPQTVLIFMEKRMEYAAHFHKDVSIADVRRELGCAVQLEKGELLIGTFGEFSFMEGSLSMRLLMVVPSKVEVIRRVGLIGGPGGRAGSQRSPLAINPTREDPKPALTKKKAGEAGCWLAPTMEDGWHEIPTVADPERRVSK